MNHSHPIRGQVLAVTMALAVACSFLANSGVSLAQSGPPVNATTFHYDRLRTGWNPNETVLTPANVSGPNFGPLWNSPQFDLVNIGGTNYAPHMYASPLYVDDVLLSAGPYAGGDFQVVLAATGNGFVYAVNAFDNSVGGPLVTAGTILWSRTLGTPSHGPDGGVPLGVLSTPTIDLSTAPPRIYVTADTTEGGRSWKVFALDLTNGSVISGWPLIINNSTVGPINQNGPTTFQSTGAMSQRGGLNLSPDGSLLYVPFGAYGDGGAGWMVAVDTITPSLASAFAGGPSGSRAFANAGLWGSGGPAIDLAGNVYDTTGNGPSDVRNVPGYWGESLLIWGPGVPLQLAGTYSPWNYCQMDDADTDLGGDTPMIIPDLDPSTTSTPHLVAFGSKQGTAYLIDRDNPPGGLVERQSCNLTDSTADGSLLGPDPQPPFGTIAPLDVFGPYSEVYTMGDNAKARTTPAYFQGAGGTSYVFCSGATKRCPSCREPVPPGLARLLVALSPGAGAYLKIDATDSVLSLFSPGSPVVTSNGSDSAIVWVLDANVYRSASLVGSGVPHPVLYALDANTMQLLWNSTSDQLNVGGKYNHVMIAHGVVFVGTDRIQAFGINPSPGGGNRIRIDAGGGAVGSFLADTYFTGGHADTFTNPIDMSGVANPAPQAVYQSKRTDSVGFTYTVPNLIANHSYLVRLHFAESAWNGPGQLLFNVAINGSPALTDFGIFQASGGQFRAVIREFTATPNSNGQIVIQYSAGSAGNALASGLEVLP